MAKHYIVSTDGTSVSSPVDGTQYKQIEDARAVIYDYKNGTILGGDISDFRPPSPALRRGILNWIGEVREGR